jgi:hypothetical protein
LSHPAETLAEFFWNPAITIPEAKTKAGEKQILSTYFMNHGLYPGNDEPLVGL